MPLREQRVDLQRIALPPAVVAGQRAALEHLVEAQREARSIPAAYVSTFLLTITNPMTILAFAAIFAGAGLATAGDAGGGDAAAAGWMGLGVFAGSAAWWLLLSSGVGLLRARINGRVLLWVNRGAGAILVVFGVLAVGRALLA